MIATTSSAGTPVRACTASSDWRCSVRKARPPSIRAWVMNIGRYSCHGLTRSAGRDIAVTTLSRKFALASVASISAAGMSKRAEVSRTKLARAVSNGTGVRSTAGAAAFSGTASAGVAGAGLVAGGGATLASSGTQPRRTRASRPVSAGFVIGGRVASRANTRNRRFSVFSACLNGSRAPAGACAPPSLRPGLRAARPPTCRRS